MKISLSFILDRIASNLLFYPPEKQKPNVFLTDQLYFFESSIDTNNPNNIEKIFNEALGGENFDELIELIARIKNHYLCDNALNEFKQLTNLYRVEFGQEETIERLFGETKPSEELVESYRHVSKKENRLEKIGIINFFSNSINFNSLDISYQNDEEKLKQHYSNLNEILAEISELKIPHLTSATTIIMGLHNNFKKLYDELINHISCQTIEYSKLFFSMLFAQLPLYYFESQNNILLNALNSIDIEKLSGGESKIISHWLLLLKKLQVNLNKAKSIYGFAYVLEKMGIEVEEINDCITKFFQISQLTIVEIQNIEKHPKSDKLNLCTVSDGHETKQIVCGASNVHNIKDKNYKTILADLGQLIPCDLFLEPREIRGVISHGMLCSLDELKIDFITDKIDGIAELPEDSIIGNSPLAQIFNNFNFSIIFDISITPNLGHLLGLSNIEDNIFSYISTKHQSLIARHVYLLESDEVKNSFNIEENATIKIADKNIEKNIIENIFYQTFEEADNIDYKTPIDFRNLLISHGFEIYSDSRDIINISHIMVGSYFHRIDLEKISGKLEIIASDKERDLDYYGKSIKILRGEIIIVDQNDNLIAIPGILDNPKFSFGEKISSKFLLITFAFQENLTNDPEIGFHKMLQIARRENLANHLIYFFERGRINESIIKLSFDTIKHFSNADSTDKLYCSNINIANSEYWFKLIKFKINDYLMLFKKIAILNNIDLINLDNMGYKCTILLVQLGIIDTDLSNNDKFVVDSNQEDELFCILPVFKYRTDINSSLDIANVIFKFLDFEYGSSIINSGFFEDYLNNDEENQKPLDLNSYLLYEKLYNEKIDSIKYGEYNKLNLRKKLGGQLINRGYNEICSFSFIDKKHTYIDEQYLINLLSPVNKNSNVLRTSIFPNLLEAAQEIQKQSVDNIAIFESGPIYTNYNIFQKVTSGLRMGNKFPRNIHENNKKEFDFYDIKADVLSCLKTYNLENLSFFRLSEFYTNHKEYVEILKNYKLISNDEVDQHLSFFHPGKSAIIFDNNKLPIGYLGEIHPKIIKEFGLNSNIVGFVIFHELLNKQEKKSFHQSIYQAVERDFSLIFDDKITIQEIEDTIFKSNNQGLLKNIKFFDIYQNEELKLQKKRSIAFNIKLQSDKETLSDKIINSITSEILKDIKEKLGGYML